jgi:SAM-dependent methyltransferase
VSAAYDRLAEVYDWLIPDALLAPEGAVAAFAAVVDGLAAGARVLDCAAGGGQLAVGLALRGFDVTASDASPAMVARARALAAHRDAPLRTAVCRWDALGEQGWGAPFDAVFCVGNSLAHAVGRDGRRSALAAMAGVLRADGLLALTSRNWERLRATRPGLELDERLVARGGRRGLVARAWTIPDTWKERHLLDVAVALIGDDGGVAAHGERLELWPFGERALREDLRAAGLEQVSSSYSPDVERYLVTARR